MNTPTLIDRRYRVLGSLGSGMSGEVFRVEGPNGIVALKLLRSAVDGLKAEDLVATFKFEFSLLKGLNHPNIVQIFDFGFDESLNRFYFTQELVTGKPITQWRADPSRLPEVEALLRQALQGLAYLHSQDIVHGDIKPDNLLITSGSGEPLLKMIDFGISHPEWAGIGGTPAYLAPEKILKMASSFPADIYSLGIVGYEALTGKNPFLRANAGETLQAQLNFSPPSPTLVQPRVDPVWGEMIEAMLRKNPRLRIASAASCLRFLETRGQASTAPERMQSLPSYWIGRKEILEAGKNWLASLIAAEQAHKILLVSGEAALGKGTLLAELKYEAELTGLEVLDWDDVPHRSRSLKFKKIGASEDLPTASQLRQALKNCSLVMAVDPNLEAELRGHLEGLDVERIVLRPLNAAEVEDYLQSVTRNPSLPKPFSTALFRLSRGYPKPLQESLRNLLKDPLIVDASGKWNLAVFAEAEPRLEQLGFSEESLEQALAGDAGATPAERWMLELERADRSAKSGKLEDALKNLQRLESEIPKIFSGELRLRQRIELLQKRGWIYSKQRRFPDAREAFASALSFLQELETAPPLLGLRIRNFLAFLNLQEGKIGEAVEEFEATARETEALPASERRRVTNNELGQAYLMKGETAKAIAQLKEDRGFFADWATPHILLKVNYNLAEALSRAADYAEATGAYEEVSRLARRERDWEYLLRAYNGLGNVASLQKDQPRSLDFYQRSLGLAEYLRDYLSAATVAQNRAVILSESGRTEEALDELETSRRLLAKVTPSSHSRYLMARAVLEIGETHRKRKEFGKARSCLNEALNRSEEDPNLKSFQFYPLAALAELALDENDFPTFRQLSPKLIHAATTPEEKSALAALLARSPADPRQGVEAAPEAPANDNPRISGIPANFSQETFQQILKINRALITEYEPEALFRKILQYATELSGAESALLLELSEGGELMVREAFNTEVDAGLKEISQQVAQRVLNTGQSVLTHDALEDRGFNQFQSVVSLHLKSIACIPIKIHQKTVGLLYLTHRYKTGLFNGQTVKALEAFGDQAGLALQNSRYLRQLKSQNDELSNRLSDAEGVIDQLRTDLRQKVKNPYPKILGKSRALVEILKLMDRISDTNLSVLILGDTGSGKELVARSIHDSSRRVKGPFVAVNCGAIPENLIESELFGYKSGAFTGATRDKKGWIEEANGGTLFLDEIAELPLNTQVKLLRVLQEREVQRLGDTKLAAVDIRIIAATHRHLEAWVQEGKFREDLYYRIAQMILAVPALRERKEDTSLLCEHFLGESAKELNLAKPPRLGKDLLGAMMSYEWPGNVRELENFIRTSTAFAERGVIHLGTLPDFLRKKLQGSSEPAAMAIAHQSAAVPSPAIGPKSVEQWKWDDYEAALFSKVLHKHQMNCERAAEELDVGIATVYVKMRKYGLKNSAAEWLDRGAALPDKVTLENFKQKLIGDSYRKHGESPYAVAKELGINVGTVYRHLK